MDLASVIDVMLALGVEIGSAFEDLSIIGLWCTIPLLNTKLLTNILIPSNTLWQASSASYKSLGPNVWHLCPAHLSVSCYNHPRCTHCYFLMGMFLSKSHTQLPNAAWHAIDIWENFSCVSEVRWGRCREGNSKRLGTFADGPHMPFWPASHPFPRGWSWICREWNVRNVTREVLHQRWRRGCEGCYFVPSKIQQRGIKNQLGYILTNFLFRFVYMAGICLTYPWHSVTSFCPQQCGDSSCTSSVGTKKRGKAICLNVGNYK